MKIIYESGLGVFDQFLEKETKQWGKVALHLINVFHMVLAKHIGPTISTASFFTNVYDTAENTAKIYGPIKELLEEEIPPIHKGHYSQTFLGK